MPDSIKAITAISSTAYARDAVTAHMIRLLNDGGLRHPIPSKAKLKMLKVKELHHDDLDPAHPDVHHIDLLA